MGNRKQRWEYVSVTMPSGRNSIMTADEYRTISRASRKTGHVAEFARTIVACPTRRATRDEWLAQ